MTPNLHLKTAQELSKTWGPPQPYNLGIFTFSKAKTQ